MDPQSLNIDTDKGLCQLYREKLVFKNLFGRLSAIELMTWAFLLFLAIKVGRTVDSKFDPFSYPSIEPTLLWAKKRTIFRYICGTGDHGLGFYLIKFLY